MQLTIRLDSPNLFRYGRCTMRSSLPVEQTFGRWSRATGRTPQLSSPKTFALVLCHDNYAKDVLLRHQIHRQHTK